MIVGNFEELKGTCPVILKAKRFAIGYYEDGFEADKFYFNKFRDMEKKIKTGLKDKNKTPICEGDVLLVSNSIYMAVDGSRYYKNYNSVILKNCHKYSEVIGHLGEKFELIRYDYVGYIERKREEW